MLPTLITSVAEPISSATTEPRKKEGPTVVSIGIYMLDFYNLDLKNGSYTADFYMWMRWRGDLDPRKFEFMNGEMEFRGEPDEKKIGDLTYVSYRVRGKFRSDFDFRGYPLDRQSLRLTIEDSSHDIGEQIYEVDSANMSTSRSFKLNGWETASPPVCRVIEQHYETNYGNPERPPGVNATYSRFEFLVPIKHFGAYLIYFKTFIGLFISVAIAFLTFLIDPTDLDPRFGVGVAGMFGAVSSMIVVSSTMPENPYFSLSDKIHLTSLSFIFFSLFASCIVLKIEKNAFPELSRKTDKILACGLLTLYILVVTCLTVVESSGLK
jgi:hypothetical protein